LLTEIPSHVREGLDHDGHGAFGRRSFNCNPLLCGGGLPLLLGNTTPHRLFKSCHAAKDTRAADPVNWCGS
jgi:hypothetical protein